MRRRRILLFGPAFALLAACNALPPADLKSPRLAFADFRIADLGLSDIRFVVTVDTENPNDIDVPLHNLDFELDLLGEPFAQGTVIDRTLTLPARGMRQVPVEFTVPTTRLIGLLRSLRGSDFAQWNYRLAGKATWGWSGVPLRFDRRGDLEALRELTEIFRPLTKP